MGKVVVRRNLHQFPRPQTAGQLWPRAGSGTVTREIVTTDLPAALGGGQGAVQRVTAPNDTSGERGMEWPGFPHNPWTATLVEPGKRHGVGCWMRVLSGGAWVRLDMRSATDTLLGRRDSATLTPGDWQWVGLSSVFPENAVGVRLGVWTKDSLGATVFEVVGGLILADIEADPEETDYFDGSGYVDPDSGLWTPDPLHKRVAWEGEENASASVMYDTPRASLHGISVRSEARSLRGALRDSHQRRIRVTMRDRDERPISSLTAPVNQVRSGQVMGDVSQDVTRSLSLEILDPEDKLRFEGRSPAQGAVYADRFVSVEYGVWVEGQEDWVDTPVFWGPVTEFARDGHVVHIEAQGKERLMLAPHFATEGYTLRKGTRLDEAIEQVARRTGERRFAIPKIDRRLRNPRTVGARAEPWKVIVGGETDAKGKRLAGLVEKAPGNRFAFYDGEGRLTVRRRNQGHALVIRERDLVEPPSVTYDARQAINTVVVRGAEPEGKGKRRARARVSLPEGHPLSPQRLARNGKSRYATEFIDTELRTDSDCEQRARQVLRRLSAQGVEAELSVLPIPQVEELDEIRLATEEYDFSFPLRHWVLPLGDGPMTLATSRRIKRPRRSHRRRRA